ncbi:hypothetical protein [Burkholderia oklahomensis]|uniref:hypothetical protein n=1 Tax=Burkholderia oklahomensis TaxID=342113 RepID=UPI000473661D|nr:hypothetical protein [Burkholderia oklahomensis]AJX34911.1 hypothetical protein BG90_3952 [Burkholderia oklahomensis C6786]AOI50327.1 hypothetical protein WI23_30260 [Burkholderia oklahomensis C6786]KUY53203.1 hypothetical protein WI23_23190 [Burkholderia oklahomensis C6786]MBI0364145.1 hypothetical protein [Burkholderia oklahomensis]SUY28506.1 Uncharacterised protein [Burkholderia oklahomensis]
MAMIVAGRFTTFEQAEAGARRLYARDFRPDDVSIFFLNPSGQHAKYPIGGDVYADSAARPGGKGAAYGAALGVIAGLVAGFVAYLLGWRYWVVWPAAALAGGYIGAFGGALRRMKGRQIEGTGTLTQSDAGVMLAAHVTGETASAAEAALRATGAAGVERVEGEWADGEWADFDPARPPRRPPDVSAR